MSDRLRRGAFWWPEDSSQQISGLRLSKSPSNPLCWGWAAEVLFAVRDAPARPRDTPCILNDAAFSSEAQVRRRCMRRCLINKHDTARCPSELGPLCSMQCQPHWLLCLSFGRPTLSCSGVFPRGCLLCLHCLSSTHPLGSCPPHFIPVPAHLNVTKVFPAHSYWNSTCSLSRLLPWIYLFFSS